jgi:hypothetical protein
MAVFKHQQSNRRHRNLVGHTSVAVAMAIARESRKQIHVGSATRYSLRQSSSMVKEKRRVLFESPLR